LAFPEITARQATMIVVGVSAAIHAVAMASLPLMVTPDGQKYIAEALQLMGRAPAMSMPGWNALGMPLFLAGGFTLLGATPVAVLLLQHALGVLCAYLVARAATHVAGPTIGLAVGLLAAIEPWSLAWTTYVLTEPLASVLAISAMWLTLTAARRGVVAAAGVGVLCAFGLLTRPAAAVLFPFFFAGWLFAHWSSARRYAIAGALVLGFTVPPLVVSIASPIQHRSGFTGGPGLVLFWGAGMFGMANRADVSDPRLQAIYDRTAGDASNPIMDDRQVRFLLETGAQEDPAAARAVGAIAVRSVLRQPGTYAQNVGYASLWLANVGIENKPPMWDELAWLTNRIFLDGREFRQNASNFQGVNFAPAQMRAFALDYRGEGPLGPWLRWWANTGHRGFPHVLLILATLIALVTSLVRRRGLLVAVLAAPLAYLLAHAVLLAAVTRYTSTIMPMMYVALACCTADGLTAWRARRAPRPGYSAPAGTTA
jgi:hypothetical protein